MLLIILLGLITVLAMLTQTLSFKRMRKYVEHELGHQPNLHYKPKLSVILPCKGLDPDFESNVEKLLAQDYAPNFEVLFAVASESDPAYPVLHKICLQKKNLTTRLIVAGVDLRRAEKINNQLAALTQISDDSKVIVFVDSDVIARNDFLTFLVSHLEDQNVGVTTGYRFYIPYKGEIQSVLRALWNRMSAWELASPKYAFAWGGAMAIRREIFFGAKIDEDWKYAADDDLSLTKAVKRLGLQVRFVPQCIVLSHGDATIREVIEWTNRQLILTKVYYPELWHRAILRAFILTFWLVAICTTFALGMFVNHDWFVPTIVGLTLLPVEALLLWQAQGLWQEVLSGVHLRKNVEVNTQSQSNEFQPEIFRKDVYKRILWQFMLALPFAHLVLPWMTLYSLCTNRIKWRGITYLLVSPSETVVV